MARLFRDVVITEKIDGTNASVNISEATGDELCPTSWDAQRIIAIVGNLVIRAGSRTKWIIPSDDNFGFAAWVNQNRDELIRLGPGHHFGEWWGTGIQRKYDLKTRRFSLFNTIRWAPYGTEPQPIPTGDPRITKMQDVLPECCDLVPVLYRGPFSTHRVDAEIASLMQNGSAAAPGFMNPEGVVTYHIAGNIGFKTTLEGDQHKG